MNQVEKLSHLLERVKAINAELTLKKQCELIMDALVEISGAERGFLILMSEEGKTSVPIARNMEQAAIERAHQKISRTVLKQVLAQEEPLVFTDAMRDEKLSTAQSIQEQKVRSICAFPLKTEEGALGVVYLDHRQEEGVFAPDDLAILRALAAQIAVALRNAQRFERKELELFNMQSELGEARTQLETRYRQTNLIGQSAAMREVFTAIDKVTQVVFPVIIYGESGTGKELVARAIHYNSVRAAKPFVAENCAAVKETLLEAELFGYKKGAFTGADRDKKGLFEAANEGTLFLDEVGCMSAAMQESLLRVLQEGEIRPVGGTKTIKVDVRLMGASNEDLARLVEESEFRKDLFYRLNVLTIRLPPLRERREDIPLLVEHLLERIAGEAKIPKRRIGAKAMALLVERSWAGNVRELENALRQAVTLSEREVLGCEDFHFLAESRTSLPKDDILSVDDYVRSVVEKHGSTADYKFLAQKLGIDRKTLWEKRKRWGLTK